MIKYKNDKIERITKKEARRLYNENKPLLIMPCKVNPSYEGGFAVSMIIQKSKINSFEYGFQTVVFRDNFDKAINCFEYYNCCYNELGKYTAFYKILEG